MLLDMNEIYVNFQETNLGMAQVNVLIRKGNVLNVRAISSWGCSGIVATVAGTTSFVAIPTAAVASQQPASWAVVRAMRTACMKFELRKGRKVAPITPRDRINPTRNSPAQSSRTWQPQMVPILDPRAT